MPLLDIPNREQLDGPARDALESVLANLIGYLYTEHDDEGSHGDITADSVTLRETGAFTLPDGTTWAVVDGVPTHTAPSGSHAFVGGPPSAVSDLLRLNPPSVTDTGVAAENTSALILGAPGIRFTEYGVYVPNINDIDALKTAGAPTEPRYTVWYMQPTTDRDIYGIVSGVVNLPNTNRGQLLILVNDSDYTLTYRNGAGIALVTERLLSADVAIAPGGAVGVIYDNLTLGWRIVWAYREKTGASRTLFSKNGTDQNVSTTATNVFDKTIPANTFNTNGQSIHWVASGSWTANANTKQVDPQFDGISLVALGPAVVNTANARWWFDAHIHRANSTNMQCVLHYVTHDAAGAIVTNSVFTTDNTMDWTAAIDLNLFLDGDATGDITVNYSKVVFYPEGV